MSFAARVIESYTVAYPNPIKLKEGDSVQIEKWEPKDSEWAGWAFCVDQRGVKGWVSEKYLRVNENSAVATRDYDATELTVQSGEMVKAHYQEFGWAWVENSQGSQGWVPLKVLQVNSESSPVFFIGEIILESLIDPSVLEPFKAFLVSSRTADVQNFAPSRWHIHRYRMPLSQVQTLLPRLENNIDKNQWYIHFYSEHGNQIFVVLSGKTFELPKQKDATWNEMIAYGEKIGVGRRWTESIPVDFHDPSWSLLETAKQFASLMDHNKYQEAGQLMSQSCRYLYQDKIIEGVDEIIKVYADNYESAQKQLDEIRFSSEVVPDAETGLFTLKYLDRIRKGVMWFEHRCEQVIKIADGKIHQIEHRDLPGEQQRLKEWFLEIGISTKGP